MNVKAHILSARCRLGTTVCLSKFQIRRWGPKLDSRERSDHASFQLSVKQPLLVLKTQDLLFLLPACCPSRRSVLFRA